jgi:hypothetical protein
MARAAGSGSALPCSAHRAMSGTCWSPFPLQAMARPALPAVAQQVRQQQRWRQQGAGAMGGPPHREAHQGIGVPRQVAAICSRQRQMSARGSQHGNRHVAVIGLVAQRAQAGAAAAPSAPTAPHRRTP